MPLGRAQKCRGHQRDVAEGQAAEGAEQRLVRGGGEALGEAAVVLKLSVGDGLELLRVVGGVQLGLVQAAPAG